MANVILCYPDDAAKVAAFVDAVRQAVTRPVEWRRGHVWVMRYVRLEPGQEWVFLSPSGHPIRMTLQSTSPDGEVHFRPDEASRQVLADIYPERDFVKGDPDPLPFKRVDARMARGGAQQGLQEGDLLCHEAWTLWASMALQEDVTEELFAAATDVLGAAKTKLDEVVETAEHIVADLSKPAP